MVRRPPGQRAPLRPSVIVSSHRSGARHTTRPRRRRTEDTGFWRSACCTPRARPHVLTLRVHTTSAGLPSSHTTYRRYVRDLRGVTLPDSPCHLLNLCFPGRPRPRQLTPPCVGLPIAGVQHSPRTAPRSGVPQSSSITPARPPGATPLSVPAYSLQHPGLRHARAAPAQLPTCGISTPLATTLWGSLGLSGLSQGILFPRSTQ